MDLSKGRLRQYKDIPIISKEQWERVQNQGGKRVHYKGLVIDISDFDHPGYNNILDTFLKKDITEAYLSKTHSLNADLIICQRTVGRLEGSQGQVDGKLFYNSVLNNEQVRRHEKILEKFNANEPIMNWIRKLNSSELQLVTEIPKLFKNPEKVNFVQGAISNFLFQEHFWISFVVFSIILIINVYWILSKYALLDILTSLPLSAIGCCGWTLVEYFAHRFQLHPTGNLPEGDLRAHLLHHSFPNLKNKIALSWCENSAILFFLIASFRWLFSDLVVGMLFMGFIATMIAYDCIHYFCHFGPELDNSWLKELRINHLKHHYRSQQVNFGVTTNFWDKVFGTFCGPCKRE